MVKKLILFSLNFQTNKFQRKSNDIKNNRKLLKNIMLQNDSKAFESEWWHYNLASAMSDKVANTKCKCDLFSMQEIFFIK